MSVKEKLDVLRKQKATLDDLAKVEDKLTNEKRLEIERDASDATMNSFYNEFLANNPSVSAKELEEALAEVRGTNDSNGFYQRLVSTYRSATCEVREFMRNATETVSNLSEYGGALAPIAFCLTLAGGALIMTLEYQAEKNVNEIENIPVEERTHQVTIGDKFGPVTSTISQKEYNEIKEKGYICEDYAFNGSCIRTKSIISEKNVFDNPLDVNDDCDLKKWNDPIDLKAYRVNCGFIKMD